ncbi:DUF2238 domain-containing protein [Ovoidimarina sediminis]|uniref:DUF2238 domain-containing protein n=1 Tax=Ovoidimarina sediminis TaxID=3079856 RepID=UPI0029138CB8|nr:DUF2238 domain-containing protein [Rhodophyticola sp. MJ-SS7]MDU8946705.1 DUF2238 domain-containing protein [Rhodophyticola sp. MJ-SS7]
MRKVLPVAVFTITYVCGFGAWFISIGNLEFIVYIATMLGLMALVGFTLKQAAYPVSMLWALSLWGLLHMAGGGLPIAGSVLYNLPLVPIMEVQDSVILKYDQAVHAYGFGVTAWLLHHLLTTHYPDTRGTWTAMSLPLFGAMGLGALNEMIEFSAVLAVPDTNVGGYINTALDLCFNALGALIAVVVVARG